MNTNKLIGLSYYVLIILSVFTEQIIMFILISVFCLSIGIKQFLSDKKLLKTTELYVRIKDPKITFKNIIILIAYIIGAILIFFTLKQLFNINVLTPLDNEFHLIISFATILTNYYHHFIDSIKSFKSGIKLPGRGQSIVKWQDIEDIKFIDELTLTIKTNSFSNSFNIDSKDYEDAKKIKEYWEKKSL